MFIEIGELTLQLVFNLDFGGIEVAPLYFIVGRHVGTTEDKKKTRTKSRVAKANNNRGPRVTARGPLLHLSCRLACGQRHISCHTADLLAHFVPFRGLA